MAASHHDLKNLVAIVDCNGVQINGWVNDIMTVEPLADKWRAFGWKVVEVNGHNMKDGTMFGRLTQYEKSIDYLKAHPFVDFSTLWHQERYVIFAVVDVSLDTSSENFLDYFAHPRFSSDAEFASYIRRAELASMYAIPMDVKPSDALLTLSTCLEENRLVVIARRQRDGESKASLRETVNMAVRQ